MALPAWLQTLLTRLPEQRTPMVSLTGSGGGNLSKIDHIVVLMMENRSFDHMLGYLKLDGVMPEVEGLGAFSITGGAKSREDEKPPIYAERSFVRKLERTSPQAVDSGKPALGAPLRSPETLDEFRSGIVAASRHLHKRGLQDRQP